LYYCIKQIKIKTFMFDVDARSEGVRSNKDFHFTQNLISDVYYRKAS